MRKKKKNWAVLNSTLPPSSCQPAWRETRSVSTHTRASSSEFSARRWSSISSALNGSRRSARTTIRQWTTCCAPARQRPPSCARQRMRMLCGFSPARCCCKGVLQGAVCVALGNGAAHVLMCLPQLCTRLCRCRREQKAVDREVQKEQRWQREREQGQQNAITSAIQLKEVVEQKENAARRQQCVFLRGFSYKSAHATCLIPFSFSPPVFFRAVRSTSAHSGEWDRSATERRLCAGSSRPSESWVLRRVLWGTDWCRNTTKQVV